MDTREDVPATYRWMVLHRRLVLAIAAGTAGFIAIVVSWIGVSDTVIVADQLSYIASGGLIGLFLLGVAAMAYWGEQRERELSRLGEIEVYLGAIARALNLVDDSPAAEADLRSGATRPLVDA
ncbi:MAG: hypothetical protein ACRD0O_07180 [Acidimicrobiia bacterium]